MTTEGPTEAPSVTTRRWPGTPPVAAKAWGAAAGLADRLRLLLAPQAYEPARTLAAVDYAVAGGFALLGLLVARHAHASLDANVYDYWNIWFQADPNRVLVDITDRTSEQSRTGLHPAFSILNYPIMHALMALGADRLTAGALLASACGAAAGWFYVLALRALGLSLLAAAAFGLVFLATATSIHWLGLIETYAYAAATLSFALFVLTSRPAKAFWSWSLSSALVFGVTITNWAFPLAASFFRLRFPDFVKVSAAAVAVMFVIAAVQNVAFPAARMFYRPYNVLAEVTSAQPFLEEHGVSPWTPLSNLRSFFLTSAVAPPPYVEEAPTIRGPFTLVNNQHSPLFGMPAIGLAATALWAALIGVGLWGAAAATALRPVAVPVVAYVGAQAALHTVYGEITFLYSANVLPCLAMIGAFGWFTPARRWVVVLAFAFAATAAVNNFAQLGAAAEMANGIAAELDAQGGVQSVSPPT
jgi:hypothetical protein